eukprot:COSAG03_NODE_10377_length_654_cov_4.736937_1_plen_163_part_00
MLCTMNIYLHASTRPFQRVLTTPISPRGVAIVVVEQLRGCIRGLFAVRALYKYETAQPPKYHMKQHKRAGTNTMGVRAHNASDVCPVCKLTPSSLSRFRVLISAHARAARAGADPLRSTRTRSTSTRNSGHFEFCGSHEELTGRRGPTVATTGSRRAASAWR